MSPKKSLMFAWLFLQCISYGLAEWTILLVMQGDNNLSYFLHQNIKILQQIGSTEQVNILVQWDEPLKHKTWRYKIGHKKLLDDATLNKDMGINPEAELVDAARWAFIKYPSKKRSLILWNHGTGILDEKQSWNKIRGILYDFSSKKCLTNKGLLRAMQRIQQEILAGSKIDLIGMDACLMAMLEIAFQIKDFGKIFVASENIQYSPGWNYASIGKNLIKKPQEYDQIALATLIVESFEIFNEKRNTVYTQSAIDLENIALMKNNISTFASTCLQSQEQETLTNIITTARLACTEFDNGNYIDLENFYKHITREIKKNKKISLDLKTSLLNYAENGCELIKKLVIRHVKGKTFSRSHGLSIYFPRSKTIHTSYQLTLFAQETLWPNFINRFKPQ